MVKLGLVMLVIDCEKCGAKNRVDEVKLASNEAKCGRCGEKLEPAAAGASDAKPAVITDQTFEREVMQEKGRPVLVDAWAPWCPP
jgi:thioredoxin-like negative regulator of GroEL